MRFYYLHVFLALIFFGTSSSSIAQTLILNEVSNGPSGNQEYVEFVVIDTAAPYICGNTAPPCIDIRGWIFDDNSGYHGAGGVAAGAVRFSNDPFWSCVPLGTIILIYNSADPNTSLPADDVSMSDGNCRLVIPISNALFETNATTPGAVACSYPATGWTSGGNWNSTLLANTGDCARVVNLAGCEVFSLCYAAPNQNTLIYFNSGGSGQDNVWFFNDTDPSDPANWGEGCADPANCGSNDQTPGLPNNAANAAFIAQFNNGCSIITPLALNASGLDGNCGCNASASVNATGSIPGYTYEWFDASFVSINQTSATATNLCAGTYHVIVTSSIGCADTATVVVNTTSGFSITVNGTDALCNGFSNGTATVTTTGGTTPFDAQWNPAPSSGQGNLSVSGLSAGTYSVLVTDDNGCTANGSVTINEPTPITVITSVTDADCNTANGSASANAGGGTGVLDYSWNTSPVQNTANATGLSAGNYTVTVSDDNNCTTTATVVVASISGASIDAVQSTAASCFGVCDGALQVTASGGTSPYSYALNGGATQSTASFTGLCAGNYVVSLSDAAGCLSTFNAVVNEPSLLEVDTVLVETVLCNGSCDGQIQVAVSGGTTPYALLWNTGSTLTDLQQLCEGVYVLDVTDANGCDASITVDLVAPDPIVLVATATDAFCGQNNGAIQASVFMGGTAPFVFSIINPVVQSNASGTFLNLPVSNYTLIATDQNGCTDTVSALVNDGGSVLADFSFTLNGTMVQFDNQSTGATNYVWNFGDGNGSVFSDPSHLYEEDSSYVVMLIAINGACADTAYATINTGSASIFIPNVFSPNNDGNNDVFGFSASGIETFHCMIYNRWGQLMAELSTPDAFWDGRDANGTEVPEGVYFFMLEATSSLPIYVATHTDLPAGKSLHAEGTVTLIRGK